MTQTDQSAIKDMWEGGHNHHPRPAKAWNNDRTWNTNHDDFTITPNLFIQSLVFILFNHIIPDLLIAQCVPVVTSFDME